MALTLIDMFCFPSYRSYKAFLKSPLPLKFAFSLQDILSWGEPCLVVTVEQLKNNASALTLSHTISGNLKYVYPAITECRSLESPLSAGLLNASVASAPKQPPDVLSGP